MTQEEIQWSEDSMAQVVLKEPDDFLKIRETLTRIGVASRREKKLYQSCHILHKKGKYYIVHFKELFALDGKRANLTLNDLQRRNRIIQLLVDWGLVTLDAASQEKIVDVAPLNQIKVIAFKDKENWTLESKYNIGKKKYLNLVNDMQKVFNALAVASFVLSASAVGAGVYAYMNRETLIEQAKREVLEAVMPKGVKQLTEKLPVKIPTFPF